MNAPDFEARRDRYGRYLVLPPDGGKPVGYTRATTIAKTLDDTSNLEKWATRMVALGLAKRPDLLAQVATLPDDDRKALNNVCEKAKEAGGATIRRDLGTAIHVMFQQSCENPDYMPPQQYQRDIDAIHRAIADAGLELVGLNEFMVVNDCHQIAGTADLVLRRISDQRLFVADLKTGSSVNYGGIGFAIQLAIYASADAMYVQGAANDGSDDTRLPMPELDQNLGIIIHCQPESATCELHWVDLQLGRNCLDLALKVRALRKFDPLVPLIPTVETKATVDAVFGDTTEVSLVDNDWRDWMLARMRTIADAGALDMLGERWPDGAPTLKSGAPITVSQGDAIAAAVATVERDHNLAFPTPQPGVPVVELTPRPVPYLVPDEGDELTDHQYNELLAAEATLDDAAFAWVATIIDGARRANRDIRISAPHGRRTQRRHRIGLALMALAPHDDTDLARACVGLAIGEPVTPDIDLAAEIGSLTIDEAERLHKIVRAINTLQLEVAYCDDGQVEIHGDIHAALAA